MFEKKDFHIHVPEGATPKDGPSAGIAMVTSIVSSITNIPVNREIAMTGEVTVTGQVLAIGGLKEKLLAAHRAGVKKVLIPKENKKDLAEIEEKEILNKALDSLEFLGLTNLKDELAGNLSGGQKKLLELGRTMMVDAKLVLLDEVGAGVNRTLLKDLGTAIQKLNKEKGYTFCMIEHDMDFIGRLCDPVIVMAEGSVLFEGSVENAKKDERVIESYLGRGSKLKDN